MKLLVGLYPPKQGEILYNGYSSTVIDLTEDPPIVARVGKGSLAPFAVERV